MAYTNKFKHLLKLFKFFTILKEMSLGKSVTILKEMSLGKSVFGRTGFQDSL